MRVLVFGPTSYIANAFIAECVRRGWDVIANIRDPIRWEILGLGHHINVRTIENEKERRGLVDLAINFAYAKDARWYESHRYTRHLVRRFISMASSMSARIVVQVSSQAVFGYAFASPPSPRRASLLLEDAYIEGKVLAEQLVLKDAKDKAYIPVIVRLGNVIGPGAVPWTATLATHILVGRPVGSGKSNATYIGNIVDYLCYIAASTEDTLRQFGPFHHLAEFSSISWRDIVEPMCETMGIAPLYVAEHRGARQRMMWVSRLTGYARYMAGILPPRLSAWLGKLAANIKPYLTLLNSFSPDDGGRLPQVMCEMHEFKSHVLPTWRPPFSFDSAIESICLWLRNAGYSDRCR